MQLRDYQKECIETINSLSPGAYLVQMATGLGKTVTFTNIPRKGRMLIVSHREELVKQPLKYLKCTAEIEMSGNIANNTGEVISASVQSLVRRLNKYKPNDFDVIVCDEAHHAAADTYKKIFSYFNPRLLLGFTATPNRADNARLNDVFSQIIFKRDLKWGIDNGYLCNIMCKRVYIGYNLSKVHIRAGDYAPGELDKAMEGTANAIAQVYREHANGATLIFAASVNHANDIASKIDGAVVVTGTTPNRGKIIEDFTAKRIPCIVNCMVFTEGTDMPLVETVIIARPTQSDSLYAQMVGRGLRLYPGKQKLTLIDCVGVTGKASLCTAPSLLGIDLQHIPPHKLETLEGDLFDLPSKATLIADCPESWIKNVQIVDLWARQQKYCTHNINFYQMPDGRLTVSLPNRQKITIPCQDELGKVEFMGKEMDMQSAIDEVYKILQSDYPNSRYIWDLDAVKKWGKYPASDKQLNIIKKKCKGFDTNGLTKMEAMQILNRVLGGN